MALETQNLATLGYVAKMVLGGGKKKEQVLTDVGDINKILQGG